MTRPEAGSGRGARTRRRPGRRRIRMRPLFLASAKTRDLMLLRLLHFSNRKQAGGADSDLLKTVTVTLSVTVSSKTTKLTST